MRPVEEQTIVITGATDGLGRALAHGLASRGATVLLHARSETRLSDTARAIQAATASDRLRTYLADFSSLEEVRRLEQRAGGRPRDQGASLVGRSTPARIRLRS